jgi:REP-associated tyrosine transposase
MKEVFDPKKYHRRSIRLSGYDYAQAGAYFITIVTWQRGCLFGEIREEDVSLNPYGELAENEWRRLEERFRQVRVDEFVVMPNHVHGILEIADVGAGQEEAFMSGKVSFAPPLRETKNEIRRAGQQDDLETGLDFFAPPLRDTSILKSGSLGAIVGAYKATTARLINGLRGIRGAPVWQRNYYEHIIRDEGEWEAIRAYIRNNPFEWEMDLENPNNEADE